jgi:hypothetical protein
MTTKNKTTKTVTAITPLSKTKAKRIARKLERALKLGPKIGELCERRRALHEEALTAGLPLDGVIRLSDGHLYTLQKRKGKWVSFEDELELKTVPVFKRTPREESAETTGATAEGGAP